ncbi:MAG: MFS transporter [Elusimicrobiota bacterium]
MFSSYRRRWAAADPDLRAFLFGILLLGVNQGILNSTFNNYLSDVFRLSAAARGALEFPRELPGFLVLFVAGALAAFPMRAWAVLIGLLSAAGVAGLGFLSPDARTMTLWMLSWSMADHLFMPVESAVGLRMAKEGGKGRRLGQISGARNLAMILGAAVVWVFARGGGGAMYARLYLAAVLAALAASVLFARMGPGIETPGTARRFVVRREYALFYWLNVLFGARKQIFLTFAPWVLVTEFGASPRTMAALFLCAAVLGVVFRQEFGVFVDRFGEKRMFYADAAILLVICAGFALSRSVGLLYGLYILDNLMFATRIARTTYLDRILVERGDMAATLSLGITLDHAVSMTVPALGGLLWSAYGYPAVFWAASLLAAAVFFVARQVDRQGPPKTLPAGRGMPETSVD